MRNEIEIIDALGGTSAVAKLCEITPQAVSQWKDKGIPKTQQLYLKAVRPDAFKCKCDCSHAS